MNINSLFLILLGAECSGEHIMFLLRRVRAHYPNLYFVEETLEVHEDISWASIEGCRRELDGNRIYAYDLF